MLPKIAGDRSHKIKKTSQFQNNISVASNSMSLKFISNIDVHCPLFPHSLLLASNDWWPAVASTLGIHTILSNLSCNPTALLLLGTFFKLRPSFPLSKSSTVIWGVILYTRVLRSKLTCTWTSHKTAVYMFDCPYTHCNTKYVFGIISVWSWQQPQRNLSSTWFQLMYTQPHQHA